MATEILPATLELAKPLLASLREYERFEVDALGDPELVLTEALSKGDAWVMLIDDEPVAVGGAIRESLFAPVHIWMLTGEGVNRAQRAFLKKSINFVQVLLDRFGIIGGFVFANHDVSIHWLLWLGFRLDGPFETDFGPVFTFEKRAR